MSEMMKVKPRASRQGRLLEQTKVILEFESWIQTWVEELGGLICGHLPSLGRTNASNCGNKMMSRGDRDKGKMGLDKICGSKGKAQMFDMGWMKKWLKKCGDGGKKLV
jgi:hypothetical protein